MKTVHLGASNNEMRLLKKVYSAPRLTYYGDVTQLTTGGNGAGGDGGGAGMSMMCWIAEVLYGVGAPRTRIVRAWLTAAYERRDPVARIVVPLYRRFGVAVATLLRKRPVLQRVFRPLFDRLVKRAHSEFTEQFFWV